MIKEAFILGFMEKLSTYDVDYEIDAYGQDSKRRYLATVALAATTALLHAKGFGKAKYVAGGLAGLSGLGGYAAELEEWNNRLAKDAIVGGEDEAMEKLIENRSRYLPDALYYKDEYKDKFRENMNRWKVDNPDLHNKVKGIINSYYPNHRFE